MKGESEATWGLTKPELNFETRGRKIARTDSLIQSIIHSRSSLHRATLRYDDEIVSIERLKQKRGER